MWCVIVTRFNEGQWGMTVENVVAFDNQKEAKIIADLLEAVKREEFKIYVVPMTLCSVNE
jgi:hypothetical protein